MRNPIGAIRIVGIQKQMQHASAGNILPDFCRWLVAAKGRFPQHRAQFPTVYADELT
jgi:hypothetical protein